MGATRRTFRLRVAAAAAVGLAGLSVVSADGQTDHQAATGDRVRTAVAAGAAAPDHGIDRLAGTDRIGTAVAVSKATFGHADQVVIARADNYADALAGASLAGTVAGPILLTGADGLAPEVAAEIGRLAATHAILLGGEAALHGDVEGDLRALGLDTERIGGTDRFDTARRIAARVPASTVYVAEGVNADPGRGWPDAVAVAGLSAATRRPILLVTRDSLPGPTVTALQESGATKVRVIGGSAAVSQAVVDEIAALGLMVDRLEGASRYETSFEVATASTAAGLDAGNVWLVTGLNWPDSLVAGPAAAASGGVLMLVHGQGLDGSPSVPRWMQNHAEDMTWIHLVGGTAAIAQSVEDDLRTGVPTGPADRVLRSVRAESAVPVTVDDRDGMFLSFALPRDPARGDDPVVQALGLLDRLAPLLQIGETEKNLHLNHGSVEDDGTVHLLFQQHAADGVPIRGAQIAVHLDDTHLLGVNGRWEHTIPDPVVPAVGRVVAEEAAIDAVLDEQPGLVGPEIVGTSTTEYLDTSLLGFGDAGPRLAWVVYVRGIDKGGDQVWRVHIDARTGAVLLSLRQSQDHTSDRDLDIFSVGGSSPSNVGCWFFTNVDNRYTEDGPVSGYTPGSDVDADNAYDFVRDTYDTYHAVGQHGLNDRDGQIEMVLDVAFSPANAQYQPWCDHLRFSDQWVTRDVVAHEFTHGVDSHAIDLEYENQSGALDESYADVAGATVDDGDWLIGEDLPAAAIPSGALRDMQTPSRSGFRDPDHMQPSGSPNGIGLQTLPAGTKPGSSNDNGFVHSNSGIPNKAFYLLAQGDTYNRILVRGIGRGVAFRLLHAVETHDLTSTATFLEARNAAVSRAQRWARTGVFGWTSGMACDVINAYAAVGLGNPDGDCDGRADGGFDSDGDGRADGTDNCITVSNWFQEDADGDGTGDACSDDDDADGVPDGVDNCRVVANPGQADTDGDGAGDACDGGRDGDDVPDASDNCPFDANPSQADLDGDGTGDACDPDRDGDGVANGSDNAPDTFNPGQEDGDGDGVGDVADNCPSLADPDQTDTDGDGLGNPCDSDDDQDGRVDAEDNCPLVANPTQQDTDGNGVGTRCDLPEITRISGDVESAIKADIVWQNLQNPARLPIAPCRSLCPDWIDPTYATTLTLTLDPALVVRVVDAEGRVVAQQDDVAPDGSRTLVFAPDPDFHYRDPNGGTVYERGGYELQIRPDASVGYATTIDLAMASG